MGVIEVKTVEEAIKKIKEAQVPLILNLHSNQIGNAGAQFLAKGIKEAQVPLTLNLRGNNIGDAEAKFLAGGIKEARVPLTLNLSWNKIGNAGAQFLAEGIKEARVPLTLDLNCNHIGDAGAQFLAEGIKEAQVPLTLNLHSNQIGNAGAQFLAGGIKEVRVPLTLNLSWNKIGNAGAQFLAEGIKEARVPLALYLNNNQIKDAGAQSLAKGIKEARVPLTLYLERNIIGEAEKMLLANAQEDNFIIDAGANPSAFLKRIEFSTNKRMLEQALGCPSVPAQLVQDYMGDRAIAWLEVAAIRALEGASHDNKYASINYKLLAAAYPIPLGARMTLEEAPALLADQLEDDVEEENNSAHEAHPHKERIKGAPQQIGITRYSLRSQERKNPGEQDDFKGQGTLTYIYNSYSEYYNSGIDQVLKLRISGLTNIVSLKSLYFGNDLRYEAWLLASDVGAILSQGNHVVVPINLDNKHWLGLLFKGFGDRVEVIYMDSEQRAMLPQLREELAHGFWINNYQSSFITAKLALQSYNNCGYEVIENFVYYLTGTRATQAGAIYVHSILVENSLLDPKVYGLKLEENSKLVKFLSNDAFIGIRSIKVLQLSSSDLIRESLEASENPRIDPRGKYEDEDDRAADNSINSILHQTSIWFKALDLLVDSARLVQQPTMAQVKKLALDYAYLKGIVSGVNGYSVAIGGAEASYQLMLGEYRTALGVAAGTVAAMALPVVLALANRPYLGLAYAACMTAVNAYNAVTNAYSFAMEVSDKDATLRSVNVYKGLAEWLASSPAQGLYDFGAKAKEYTLQINDLLFEKEKSVIQAQMKGEFEHKVFNYIYLLELIEKYVLLSDVIRGRLTEEEAETLKPKPVAISYGELEYDYCVRTEDFAKLEETAEHYYCCNIAGQLLDHVVITNNGSLEVLENL